MTLVKDPQRKFEVMESFIHDCCRLGVLSSEPNIEFLNPDQLFCMELLIFSLVG